MRNTNLTLLLAGRDPILLLLNAYFQTVLALDPLIVLFLTSHLGRTVPAKGVYQVIAPMKMSTPAVEGGLQLSNIVNIGNSN